MRRLNILLYTILLATLLLTNISLAQVLKDVIEKPLDRIAPEPTLDKERALIDTDNVDVEIDKFIVDSGDEASVSITATDTISNLCFEFDVDTSLIEIEDIKVDGFLWFDSDLKDLEEKTANKICYNGVNIESDKVMFTPRYFGSDTIKYNITFDNIVLDPYIVGELQTSSSLVISIPFVNNSTEVKNSNNVYLQPTSINTTLFVGNYKETSASWVLKYKYNTTGSFYANTIWVLINSTVNTNGLVNVTINYTDGTLSSSSVAIVGATPLTWYNYSYVEQKPISNILFYMQEPGTGEFAINGSIATRSYNVSGIRTQYFNVNGLVWSNSFNFWTWDNVTSLKNEVNTSRTSVANGGVVFNSSGANFDGVDDWINTTYNSTLAISRSIKYRPAGGSIHHWVNAGGSVYEDNVACDFCIATLDPPYRTVSGYIHLGKNLFDGNYYNGSILDFKVYNRTLSVGEINSLYYDGNFSTNKLGEANSSIFLNGNEYLRVQNYSLDGMTKYSTSVWVKAPVSYWKMIWDLHIHNLMSGQLYTGIATVEYPTVNDNTWHNIITVNNGSSFNVYKDGILVNSTTSMSNYSNQAPMYIGRWSNDDSVNFVGEMSNFMVYNYALGDAEIQQLYNGFNSSINITFKDENSNVIVDNVTASFYDGNLSTSKTTTTGNIFYNGFSDNEIRVRFSASGYNTGEYFYTMPNYTNANVTLYLQANNTVAVSLLVYDYGGTAIEGARIVISKYVGGVLTPVIYTNTDYQGLSLVYLNSTEIYSITVSGTGYSDKTLSIVPQYDTYRILIGSAYDVEYPSVLDNITYDFGNRYDMLWQNQSYLFNYSISSSNNNLSYFGLEVNNSGTVTNNTSYDSGGGRVSLTITPPINDSAILPVSVRYFYKMEGGTERHQTMQYWAYTYNLTNNTVPSAFDYLRSKLSLPEDGSNIVNGILVSFITIGLIGLVRYATPVHNPTALTILGLLIMAGFCALHLFSWVIWSTLALPYIVLKVIDLAQGLD
jgi:hypothetical protein